MKHGLQKMASQGPGRMKSATALSVDVHRAGAADALATGAAEGQGGVHLARVEKPRRGGVERLERLEAVPRS